MARSYPDPVSQLDNQTVYIPGRDVVRCLVCKGEYKRLLSTGIPYLHRCPPLSEPEKDRLPPPQQVDKDARVEREGFRNETALVKKGATTQWKHSWRDWRASST